VSGTAPAPPHLQQAIENLAPTQRCMIMLPSSAVMADLVERVWKSRAPLALLKPTTSRADTERLIRLYDPTLLIHEMEGAVKARVLPARNPHLAPVTAGSITVFTSGTTGSPKGVVLPRSAVQSNALKVARIHGFGKRRPHGTCLDLFHVNALMMSLLGTHLTDERLVVDTSGSVHQYFAALDRNRVRTASANPQILRQIVREAPPWPRHLDYMITAAGPCGKNLATEFYAIYGPRLRQGYGLSEAVNFSFMMPRIDTSEQFEEAYTAQRPPVGRPIEGTTYLIEDGELVINTPDLMAGYLTGDSPKDIARGILRTGDYAEERDGLVVLLGRLAESIDIDGLPSAPGLIEDRLDLPLEVGDYAVMQIPGTQKLALHTSEQFPSGLLASTVDPTLLPIDVLSGGALLLSASGKVRRTEMGTAAAELLATIENACEISDFPLRARCLLKATLGAERARYEAHAMGDLSFGLCACLCYVTDDATLVEIDPECGRHDPLTTWDATKTPSLVFLQSSRRPMPTAGLTAVSVLHYCRTRSKTAVVALKRRL
jgi:long-chain acyl-CoA synthetase